MRNTTDGACKVSFLLTLLLVSSCSDSQNALAYLDGLSPTFDVETARASTNAQSEMVEILRTRAGLTAAPGPRDPNWKLITHAGIEYVDEQCEIFVDALFRFDRLKGAATTQLSLTAAAAEIGLAIAEAATEVFGFTALAFGYGISTIDNLGGSLLYELDPTGVRTVIERSQEAYVTAIVPEQVVIDTRPAAFGVLRGYLAICLPAYIEQQVNAAVGDTDFAGAFKDGTVILNRESRAPAASAGGSSGGGTGRQVPEPIQTATPPPPVGCGGALTAQERAMDRATCQDIQRALCTRADGDFGPSTRAALRAAQEALGQPADGTIDDSDVGWFSAVVPLGDCFADGYLSTFERVKFDPAFQRRGVSNLQGLAANIEDYWQAQTGGPPPGMPATVATLSDLRPVIEATRAKINEVAGSEVLPVNGEVTDQFWDALL
jgi:peptidoglycan hydrolase-like protein with peptidoglycan-binding domain